MIQSTFTILDWVTFLSYHFPISANKWTFDSPFLNETLLMVKSGRCVKHDHDD